MFTSISQSWYLLKRSFAVLKEHPRLIALPAMSGMIFLILVAVVLIISGEMNVLEHIQQHRDNQQAFQQDNIIAYVIYFISYFLSVFITTYFNAALVLGVIKGLRNEPISIAACLRETAELIPSIFAWSLVASTVGVLLNMLSRNRRGTSSFITSIIGGVWSIIIFFVVPIIVLERKGPFQAVSDSAKIIKDKWGTQLSASISFGLIQGLFLLPFLIGLGLAFAMIVSGEMVSYGAILLVVCVTIMALNFMFFAALKVVLQTIFYLYVKQENTPLPIDDQSIEQYFY